MTDHSETDSKLAAWTSPRVCPTGPLIKSQMEIITFPSKQSLSNYIKHQNHLEDLLKQISGPMPRVPGSMS